MEDWTIISAYTSDQAVEDGIKIKLAPGLYITTNALMQLSPVAAGADDDFTRNVCVAEVLGDAMRRYDAGDYGEGEDVDQHFAVYTVNGMKVWFILDGEGMHILLPEDY